MCGSCVTLSIGGNSPMHPRPRDHIAILFPTKLEGRQPRSRAQGRILRLGQEPDRNPAQAPGTSRIPALGHGLTGVLAGQTGSKRGPGRGFWLPEGGPPHRSDEIPAKSRSNHAEIGGFLGPSSGENRGGPADPTKLWGTTLSTGHPRATAPGSWKRPSRPLP